MKSNQEASRRTFPPACDPVTGTQLSELSCSRPRNAATTPASSSASWAAKCRRTPARCTADAQRHEADQIRRPQARRAHAAEQELARAIRVSLGTVQKALAKLASDGWIVREHGRGTFVHGVKQPIAELWHYRFLDPATGRLAPVYSRLLERRLTTAPGPWQSVLGADPQGYVEITRLISVGDRLNCWSRMHLGASRFSRLLELPAEIFDNVNLKQIFQQRFDMPTVSATQTIKAARFDAPVCEALGLPSDAMGLDLEITARTRGGRTLSYQRILIPPSDFALDVSPLHGEPPSPR